jgi:integrase/recombinase XerC
MKLSTAVTQFIAEVRATKSKATATAYESDLRRLAAKSQWDTVLRFAPDLVRLELETCSREGCRMSTLHRKRACFNMFGRWGVKNGLWVTNPLDIIDRIKRPKHLPRPFSVDEMTRLMALDLPPEPAMLRDVLAFTGLRITPACHLKVGDVSFEPPTIRAWVKGARTQVIQVHPVLAVRLRAYIHAQTDGKPQSFLFTNRRSGPMHRRTAERLVAGWGRQAAVPSCQPHRFRHSFASELVRQKQDIRVIKDALGHEDISSTMVYTQVVDEQVRAAVATLPWGAAPPPREPGRVPRE